MSAETTVKCDGCQRPRRRDEHFGSINFFPSTSRAQVALQHDDWHFCSERCLVSALEEALKRARPLLEPEVTPPPGHRKIARPDPYRHVAEQGKTYGELKT